MGQPTFDTWKIIPVGMILFALTDERACRPYPPRGRPDTGGLARRGRRAVSLAVLRTVFSHDSLSWDKSSKRCAELRKPTGASARAARPRNPPVLAAPSGGQPEGRYDREDKTKPWRLSVEDNRNGFQVSIKGILT